VHVSEVMVSGASAKIVSVKSALAQTPEFQVRCWAECTARVAQVAPVEMQGSQIALLLAAHKMTQALRHSQAADLRQCQQPQAAWASRECCVKLGPLVTWVTWQQAVQVACTASSPQHQLRLRPQAQALLCKLFRSCELRYDRSMTIPSASSIRTMSYMERLRASSRRFKLFERA
jgi:hypothetical protein